MTSEKCDFSFIRNLDVFSNINYDFMIWMMAMPNGLLSFKVIAGNLNLEKYITLLAHNVVPITKLNYGENWFHKSKKIKDFMIQSGISVLEWPPKTPDLNIIKDCWKIISDLVYDGKQFTCKNEFVHKITAVINHLNRSKREKVVEHITL